MSPAPEPTEHQHDGAAVVRLFDTVRQGLFVGWISADACVTHAVNSHLKLMLGWAPETPDALVTPLAPGAVADATSRQALFDALARNASVTDFPVRLLRRNGEPLWVEWSAVARAAAVGGLDVEAIVRDVSERKRLDDQARDLYQQLLQAEKMAALGQTISGVAHELNNPLATILASAEQLARRPVDPAIRRGLETILGEAERAAKIVRNLLTFARKRHTTRAMVDLNQVVRETLALRQYGLRATNIDVIDALAAGLPPLFADPYQLQQILLNLVINAEQAMLSAHGRGVLTVRSWQHPDRDAVVLEVNDDGPGVPETVLPRIFDPFFTTKASGQGTGLGLTVAYAIAEEHGGSLRVESSAAGGASFFLELPTGGTSVVAPAPTLDLAPGAGAGAHVLLVEDEAALAAAVSEGMRDAGFLVTEARDGEEGLARLGERAFDLVVCDLRMPRMDGPAFYRAMAAATPALARRVIFVTGDVAGTEAERFLEESGCRWLAKPFRLSELLRTVREVLA
jgi:two-component system NtrC family sensor kinase